VLASYEREGGKKKREKKGDQRGIRSEPRPASGAPRLKRKKKKKKRKKGERKRDAGPLPVHATPSIE